MSPSVETDTPGSRGAQPESIVTFPVYPLPDMKIGQLGTGFVEDEPLGATEEAWGGEAGSAQVDRADASGAQTPGPRYAGHVGDLREGEAELRLLERRVELESKRDSARPTSDKLRERADGLHEQVEGLKRELEASRRVRDVLGAEVDVAERDHRDLPRAEQGIVTHWQLPLLIAVAVSLIDVGVLHLAFDKSDVSELSVWLNTIAIPLAVLGMIFAFGWLAGLVALAIPPRARVWVGIATLALALLTLFGGLVLLTVLRDAVVDAKNHAFDGIATGDPTGSVPRMLKTTFLGPLQGAAVWAGVIAEGLYVMGDPGRRARERIAKADRRRDEATRRCDEQAATIAALEQQERDARVEAQQALVDGAEANAELRALDARLAATRKSIRGAVEAAADRYEMERLIAERKARNGAVRLASRASRQYGSTTVTPGPSFVNGGPPPAPTTAGASTGDDD